MLLRGGRIIFNIAESDRFFFTARGAHKRRNPPPLVNHPDLRRGVVQFTGGE